MSFAKFSSFSQEAFKCSHFRTTTLMVSSPSQSTTASPTLSVMMSASSNHDYGLHLIFLYLLPNNLSNIGMPTVAAIAPKPHPTRRRLPFPLTTFNLGGYNTLMCFHLKPAPLNISPVLLLVGREVMVRLFGMSLFFIL